ncbi:DinB family protein [Parasegetibacter sp. NRK P23]|uniref:DinB family protein n=1 Tax=Parasegetibacter sp. NRK P23 TaxID=2942999 RepID=UPI002042F545|nr:DinB family protein [Parasegetibacter sp. NRK P23]MCM5527946.1 DinB family protein [Parasegetibacter sp. NRK P23]
MKRSAIVPMPEFFDRYINLVEDVPVVEALTASAQVFPVADMPKIYALGDKVYAPGKWTIKDVVQHIIDNERIQAYRALRFARNDASLLPGYDEEPYAKEARAERRSLEELLEEFEVTRRSNILLFSSFTEEMLLRKGICFGKEMSVLALGFVLAGHQEHHVRIVRERYFPLV